MWGHVTHFWNFGTPLISRERLKLETSNLARRRIIKVTLQVNGNSQFLGVRPAKTIGAIKIKSGTNDYVGEGNPHAKFFGNIPITEGFSPSQQSSVEL